MSFATHPERSGGSQDAPLAPARAGTRIAARALLLLLSFSVITFLLLSGKIPFSSDQAVPLLQARDIRNHGLHPVFYDGVEYAGTFEQHLLAALFSVVPESVVAYRVFLSLFYGIALLCMFEASRTWFSLRAAVLTGLLVALAPLFIYFKALTSDGAYASLIMLGAAVLLGMARVSVRSRQGKSIGADAHILMLILGLCWWVVPIAVAFAAPLGMLFITAARSRKLRWWVLTLPATFVLGGFPWWVRNIRRGWLSLHNTEMRVTDAQGIARHIADLFLNGYPALFGARVPEPGAGWSRDIFPFAPLLLGAAILVLLAGTIRKAFHAPPVQRDAFFLLFSLAGFNAATAMVMARTSLAEPRYLLPTFLAASLLFGWCASTPGRDFFPARAALVVLVLLATRSLTMRLAATPPFPETELMKQMRSRGINAVYASYWDAYRLSVLSQGRITGTPFGTVGLVRRLGDRGFVDSAPNPAFLLRSWDAVAMRDFLRRRKAPFYAFQSNGWTLFSSLDRDSLGELRDCYCIPFPGRSDTVRWLSAEIPGRMQQDEIASAHVRLLWKGPLPYEPGITIQANWLEKDKRVPAGIMVISPFPLPGQEATIELPFIGGIAPGSHVLAIDAVDGNTDRLQQAGVASLHARVTVLPPSPAAR